MVGICGRQPSISSHGSLRRWCGWILGRCCKTKRAGPCCKICRWRAYQSVKEVRSSRVQGTFWPSGSALVVLSRFTSRLSCIVATHRTTSDSHVRGRGRPPRLRPTHQWHLHHPAHHHCRPGRRRRYHQHRRHLCRHLHRCYHLHRLLHRVRRPHLLQLTAYWAQLQRFRRLASATMSCSRSKLAPGCVESASPLASAPM